MSLIYGFKASDLVEENRTKNEFIVEINNWILERQKIINIPRLIDEQIASFLLSCDNDVEATKTTIKAFYKTRKDGETLFKDRNINIEDLQIQLRTVEFCVFPVRTEDNCAIIFHRLYDTTYSAYNMEHSMKLLFMTIDAAIYDNPPKGLVIIFDMKGVGLMHLTRVKLNCVKVFFQYLQEGLPVKLNKVHVFNSTMLDKVMMIMKPFIKKEVLALVHFHSSNLNWDNFYETYVSRKCLPSDYGGALPPIKELHEDNTKKLRDLTEFFEEEEKQRKNAT